MLIFIEFALYWKFLLCVVFLHKFYIWKQFCCWDIGQNALRQSNCKIFKPTSSPEQIHEAASFSACWYNFTKLKRWSKLFLFGHGQKLTVSQGLTDGNNCFFHAGTNSHKLKGDWNILGWAWSNMDVSSLMMGLENWLYMMNEQMEWIVFLHADTDSQKFKAGQKFFVWPWSKMSVANLVMGL